MDTGQDARLDHPPEARHHGLLIRRDDVHAGEEPESESNQDSAAAVDAGNARQLQLGESRRAMVMRMRARMGVTMRMTMAVMMPNLRPYFGSAHCALSPRIITLSSSESELRIAVVLSSNIFLYDSSVRRSL